MDRTLLGRSPWTLMIGVVAAGSLLYFLVRGFQERRRAIRLRKQGFSMPPHHPIFGHMFVLNEIMSSMPKDAHPHHLADKLRRKYPDLGSVFYIDAWPFMTFALILTSPATINQCTTERVLLKFPAIKDFLYPLANGNDLVSMDGHEWKYWREMFNPGFSAGHLMTLVPDIVEGTKLFVDILKEHAVKRDIFRMKDLTDDLAMDVIGKIVLDSNLDCQRKSNPMVNALRRQMNWMVFGSEANPFSKLNPLKPFVHWYNTRIMDRYISPEVDARFQRQKAALKSSNPKSAASHQKSVIDLALKAYQKQKGDDNNMEQIDPLFKSMAINQMKLFLFSGHDTTSSTVCYVLYLLYANPHVIARVRKEHDDVLGANPSEAADRISRESYLLNKLPYTLAVIKESMRLFPVASTTRRGDPTFTVTDLDSSRSGSDGLSYPADENTLIWMVSHACHRNTSVWPRADEFLPERWLVSEGHELHPARGGWRPFELGPRSCIGKEMSMIELKIIVCLVARSMDIEPAYTELDALEDGTGKKGRKVMRTIDGERAYQVGKGEPTGHLPCRVKSLA